MEKGYKLYYKDFTPTIYDEMVNFCNENNLIIKSNEDNWEITEYIEPTIEEKWLTYTEEQRNDKAFLFSKLKYKFLDNDINKGIDTTKPLIEINGEILTCDECLEKIVQYTYDVGQVKKKNAYIYARKKAKQYIREVIGDLGEDTEE